MAHQHHHHHSSTDEDMLTNSNTVRKSIARVLTVINQKQRQNLRDFYKKSKCESIFAVSKGKKLITALLFYFTTIAPTRSYTLAIARFQIQTSPLTSDTRRPELSDVD